jgi:hypothetical protein
MLELAYRSKIKPEGVFDDELVIMEFEHKGFLVQLLD